MARIDISARIIGDKELAAALARLSSHDIPKAIKAGVRDAARCGPHHPGQVHRPALQPLRRTHQAGRLLGPVPQPRPDRDHPHLTQAHHGHAVQGHADSQGREHADLPRAAPLRGAGSGAPPAEAAPMKSPSPRQTVRGPSNGGSRLNLWALLWPEKRAQRPGTPEGCPSKG